MIDAIISQVLIGLLAIFIPIMFNFSKNLIENVVNEKECDEKTNIIHFNSYSGFYLQCYALFIIFQIMKIPFSEWHDFLNSGYLIAFILYMGLEDFKLRENKEDKKIICVLASIFCIIPIIIWTLIGMNCSQDIAALRDKNLKFSLIASMFYLLIWFFLPVAFHPLGNLYKLLGKGKNGC